MLRKREHNHGIRKVCDCRPRAKWLKCSHPWHFSYKHKDVHYRFSLDAEFGRHIETKSEAAEIADRLRVQIREGKFRRGGELAGPAGFTVRQIASSYTDAYLAVVRPRILKDEIYRLGVIARTLIPRADGRSVAFGDLPASAVTPADVDDLMRELVKARRRKHCRCGREKWPGCEHGWHNVSGGNVAANRHRARLSAMFAWAVHRELVSRTPFRREGVSTKTLRYEEHERYRRLDGDEETRLLEHAGSHLSDLIVTALETACRLGELLSLQWHQVNLERRQIRLPGRKTKSGRDRMIPVSNALLKVLIGRQKDPDGDEYPAAAFVFGNVTGTRVRSIKTAWRATCRRATIVGLHFHDLRRETASRLLPFLHLHGVRELLGHANISTTSRYLRLDSTDVAAGMRAYERARDEAAGTAPTTINQDDRSVTAERVN